MAQFLGTLNSNEIYNALYNWIINQQVFDIKVATPTLANALKVEGTLYGDTYTYYSTDIGQDAEWLQDLAGADILVANRNTNQTIQSITLDVFRQTNITIDHYLTKRAWQGESTFAQFNGVLSGSLTKIKEVYENGLINTFVGTELSTLSTCNITIPMSNYVDAYADNINHESKNRLEAQIIMNTLNTITAQMNDNTRDYNELGYVRATSPDELIAVWNIDAYNKILDIDLPTVYNNGGLKPEANYKLLQKYFGTRIATAGTSTGVERAYKQGMFGTTYLRFGDIIPAGVDYGANEAYTVDDTIICKLFPKSAIPFLSSMVVSTSFDNPASLNQKHYLTWGHNTLERLKNYPFITIRLDGAVTPYFGINI